MNEICRNIINRRFGERFLADLRPKSVLRSHHFIMPPAIGKIMYRSNILTSSFIRFCIVGVVATAIHYGIYWLMLKLMTPTPAFTIGYIVSFCFNFFLTAKFTFKKKATSKKGIGFAMSHLVNYGLQTGLLNIFILIGFPEQFAAIPVYFICVPVNYLLVRFVFSKL